MSFVFCVRQDGTFFEGISNNVCVEWTTAMYPTSPPVPGIWSQVPSILLPEGAAVGYFNAHAFSEQVMVPWKCCTPIVGMSEPVTINGP